MPNDRPVVLVTSGTGKIGSEFVRLLAAHPRQPEVRFATRSPDGARARLLTRLNPETVRPVGLDAGDPSSIRAAAEGVDGVLLIAPFSPDMAAWHQTVIDAIKQVAFPFVAKVSVTGAREPEGEPVAIPERHGAGEKILRESGLPNASIRPTIFAQHFMMSPVLYQAGDDRFHLPTADTAVAFLDCRDIAAMAASLLMLTPERRSTYDGQAWELTGSQAVSGAEIAAILSELTGRAFRHVDGEDAFVARAAELGVPDGVKAIYAEARGGWFSRVEHDPFTELVGRSPRSFVHFAMDHVAHFAGR